MVAVRLRRRRLDRVNLTQLGGGCARALRLPGPGRGVHQGSGRVSAGPQDGGADIVQTSCKWPLGIHARRLPMASEFEPPTSGQTSPGLASSESLNRWRFISEVTVALTALVTLLFLSLQTFASRQQAELAANQASASRLDGIYVQLLDWDKWLSSQENRKFAVLWFKGTPFKDVKNREDLAQLYQANIWFVDYFDYVYTTLPGLIGCIPKDGHLVLRGSREDAGRCDTWTAWSQTIYEAFRSKNLCQTLNDGGGAI